MKVLSKSRAGRLGRLAVLALCLIAAPGFPAQRAAAAADDMIPLVILVAASLHAAIEPLSESYTEMAGQKIEATYGASVALAQQISNGFPADLIISADQELMDTLAEHKLIKPETRRILAANRLVMVAPRTVQLDVTLERGFSLIRALDGGRLAIANPSLDPAGKYAKAALEWLGVWPQATGRLMQADSVKLALMMVSREEARLGIVFATDALTKGNVHVVDYFPPESYPPILYPVAVIATSENARAPAFLNFLLLDFAQKRFARQGFLPPP
ncbi:MAG: molybdate ABC transporter substrate-binding protein [Rhodospirillaceae bacterium]